MHANDAEIYQPTIHANQNAENHIIMVDTNMLFTTKLSKTIMHQYHLCSGTPNPYWP